MHITQPTQRQRDDAAAYRYLSRVPKHGRIRITEPSTELQNLVKVLKAVQRQHHYTTAMGNSWQVPGEAALLERVSTPSSAQRPIRTLCEIGFNAGHSAAALLLHNNATLHEFDTMALKWSTPCLEVIERAFPGRVVLHKGDSRREGPAFAARVNKGQERPCDVFFIDGRTIYAHGARTLCCPHQKKRQCSRPSPRHAWCTL